MGGFYGSVQVRTAERERVVGVAAVAAKKADLRILVGPAIAGWVGVYPEGAGQDRSLGEFFAAELGGDVLHAVVHDDGVMAYWLWHEGELADSYWSAPGYFNSLDKKAQTLMTGDPQAFGPLLGAGQADAMVKVLSRERQDVPFEAARLQQFAELLSISNAVTSYEYLKSGDRIGIVRWNEFVEVPDEAVAAERLARRERRQRVEQRKDELKQELTLLADVAENDVLPRSCSAAGGMLVAWEGFGRGDSRLDFYRAPWGEAEPAEIETGGQVNALVSDATGQRVAMALGNRVVVWETAGWNPILELVESDWATQAALSADGRLLAYASREGVFVHDVDSGERLTALSTHDGKALAFHPGGQWLMSAGSAVWIAPIAGKSPWRELYPGGRTALAPELSEAVKKEMTRVNLDAMEQKWRTAMEAAVAKMAAAGQNSAATEQFVAKMREQMDKQLQQMRDKFAKLKEGNLPPPRHGNENVLCGGFTLDGSRLFLGTDAGLRVFDWEAVKSAPADAAMPRPVLSHDPPANVAGATGQGLIYAAAEVPGRAALLFGGYRGMICHFDLKSGDVRDLAAVPDGGAIVGLTVTTDAMAVGVCSRPALGEAAEKDDERAVWQIWSYSALLGMPTTYRNLSPQIVIEELPPESEPPPVKAEATAPDAGSAPA